LADHDPKLPDATDLVSSIHSGEKSCIDVIEEHLELLDSCQPRLNAATDILKASALEEARNPRPGPLSGLPVSVKETFGLAGASITAGSKRMPAIACHQDADAVARLRAAGAIVLARSNVPEFAMSGETENLIYGRTANPLNVERTCGGSSGGEGALVASGSTAAGIGSDILGSVRIPSSFCGLVGFKPTSDAVSKRGAWPDLSGRFMDSWLSVGPLTRSVRDSRLLYGVLAKKPPAPPTPPVGLRLILPEDFPLSYRDPSIPEAVGMAGRILAGEGLVPQKMGFGQVRRWYRTMLHYLGWELVPELVSGLTDAEGKRFSLARESLLRIVGRGEIYDGLFKLLLMGSVVRFRSRRAAGRAVAAFEDARQTIRNMLGSNGVLLLPTLGTLAPRHGEMNRIAMKPGVNGIFTATTFCNYLDLPAVTVPAWPCRDPESGLVPGVMLVTSPGAEGSLFDAAAALERGMAEDDHGSQ
jgi:aspartyl-tRNA(Asn)/glutamyl-tRNA(Gln) amidotransferase subunit A/fatty acid amide hydrolase 2